MVPYVAQAADGEYLGLYEVAVWRESEQQYVSNGGPYFKTLEQAEEWARELNAECDH